jgi:hypothetical protein
MRVPLLISELVRQSARRHDYNHHHVYPDVRYWVPIEENGTTDDLNGAFDFSCYSSS